MGIGRLIHLAEQRGVMESQDVHREVTEACQDAYHKGRVASARSWEACHDRGMGVASLDEDPGSNVAERLGEVLPFSSSLFQSRPQVPSPTSSLYRLVRSCGRLGAETGCGGHCFAILEFAPEACKRGTVFR